MALAPFFGRIYTAVGRHVGVSREDLAKALGATRVGLELRAEPTANEQTIATASVNLASRLYPALAIKTTSQLHREQLIQLARSINPDIELVENAPPELTVAIGVHGHEGSLQVSAAGWMAAVGIPEREEHGPENPYASTAAAALAWSEVFRRVFLRQQNQAPVRMSLLDYSEDAGRDLELAETSIGQVLFVGVGAVGNAALWTMARDPRTAGNLTLLDHENLSLSNLQRYALGTMANVGESKVSIAAQALERTQFATHTVTSTLESYGLASLEYPTICISLDNVAGRRAAQAFLPRLVVNGWTGEGSLGASWHRFDNGQACLACLYHPHGLGLSVMQQAARAFGLSEARAVQLWLARAPLEGEERRRAAKKLGVAPNALTAWKDKSIADLYTDVVCGATPIDLPGVKNVEVVPLAHQSMLAGAMMAAELLKRTEAKLESQSQPEPLVAWEDVLRPPPREWRRPRSMERGCICGDPIYQAVYRDKWGGK